MTYSYFQWTNGEAALHSMIKSLSCISHLQLTLVCILHVGVLDTDSASCPSEVITYQAKPHENQYSWQVPATVINEEVDSQALQRYRAHWKPKTILFLCWSVSQSHALSPDYKKCSFPLSVFVSGSFNKLLPIILPVLTLTKVLTYL